MRKGNGSLRLTATICGAVGIGLVSSLLIALAIGAAGPVDRINAAYAAMGERQIEGDQSESQPGAIRSGRILFALGPYQAGNRRVGPSAEQGPRTPD